MLKLDLNERSDFPGDWLQRLSIDTLNLWRYPERSGLEQKIAEHINETFESSLSSANVFCSNGGDEAIYLLMRMIKESSKLILPLPAFSQYTWGLKSWDLNTTIVDPADDLSIDIAGVKKAIAGTTNATVVLTTPNNPTGQSISEVDLVDILSIAKQNCSWVFLDEAYIEFSDFASAVSLLNKFDNLVILRTFSKAYGLAGIRLGYCLGSEEIIDQFKQRAMPFNIPAPTLYIGEAALEEVAQDDMKHYCSVIKQNRKELSNWLFKVGLPFVESQANFVLIKFSQQKLILIQNLLKERNIKVRAFPEGFLAGYIRITIPYRLEQLLSVLQKAFEPKLICCDMDGVLIETSASYDSAIKATFKAFTDQEVNDNDINLLRSSGGFNNDWVLTQALIEKVLDNAPSLNTVTERFQEFYLGTNAIEGFINNEQPLINVEASQKIGSYLTKFNANLAIVTGRPRSEAELGQQLIAKQHTVWQQANLVSDDDVKESKPSPEGINNLCKKLEIEAGWMVGDTPDDIQAALASGSIAIGIGTENKEALLDAGAHIVLENINQLSDLLV